VANCRVRDIDVETVAIALYALGGMVAAPIFCFLVARYSRQFPKLSAIVWWGSVGLLAVFSLDVVWVYIASAVTVRAAVGPTYFPVHTVVTLFAAPAFASLLLAGHWKASRWWPAVAVLAWCLGIFAIFYQYNVAEALYGVDGSGGPYS
jgi:MFS family permease